MRLLAFTLLVVLATSSSSTQGQPLEADEWRTLGGRPVNGCQATDIFAPPLQEGMNCIVSVKRDVVCDGGEKSTDVMEFIAIRPDQLTTCTELDPAVDFFPSSVFERDPTLLPVLRKAAKLLKRESSRPSSGFRALGLDVTDELREKQMATLDTLEIDTSNFIGDESYELVFELPQCKCGVALYLSLETAKYEWVRLID